MLVLAFDLDLKFMVKYWPKLGTWAKFNTNGRVLMWWLPLMVQQCQNGGSDIDLEIRSKFRGHVISIGTALFNLAPPIGRFLVYIAEINTMILMYNLLLFIRFLVVKI